MRLKLEERYHLETLIGAGMKQKSILQSGKIEDFLPLIINYLLEDHDCIDCVLIRLKD